MTRTRVDLRPHAGRLLVLTGIGHCLVGLAYYSGPLGDIVQGGFFDSIGTNAERDAALWFMVCGVLLVFLGGFVHWTQARLGTLPAFFGWGIVAVSVTGALLMPASGFWLTLLLGMLLVAVARQPARLPR